MGLEERNRPEHPWEEPDPHYVRCRERPGCCHLPPIGHDEGCFCEDIWEFGKAIFNPFSSHLFGWEHSGERRVLVHKVHLSALITSSLSLSLSFCYHMLHILLAKSLLSTNRWGSEKSIKRCAPLVVEPPSMTLWSPFFFNQATRPKRWQASP